MILKMTIVGEVKPPDPQDISHSFGPQGGKIGRGLSNEWVLPDPHMSKNHCAVTFRNGAFMLTDTSTNGVFLNGSPERVERGASVAVSDGDRLRFGDYEVRLEIDETADAGAVDSSDDLDSFAKVLGVDMDENLDPFEINSSRDRAPASTQSDPVAGGLPDDPLDDLLDQPPHRTRDEDPLFSNESPARPVIPPDEDLFDDLLENDERSGSDDSYGSLPSEQDHLPSSHEFFQPPKVAGEQIPDDWDNDDLLESPDDNGESGRREQAVQAPPQTAPAASSTQVQHPELPPEPAPGLPPPTAPERAQMPVSNAEATLLQAFLEGAGMSELDIPEAARIEMMRTVGQTYRDLVGGLVDVLKVRQSIKNEFRLDQTMIRAEDNNPLKFTVNVEEALKAMLGSTSRGYLTPRKAVDQGFTDIKAHQIAVMAGMQVALKALLMRFDPEELEARLSEGSVFDKVLPGSKKARYWELFTQLYEEIAKEAEDDFHGLFGREFARAYEEQAKKV